MLARQLLPAAFLAASVLCRGEAADQGAPATLVVPSGDRLLLALEHPLSTKSARKGTPIDLRMAHDLFLGNRLALPRGLIVQATVTEAHRRRHVTVADRPELRIRFDELILPGGAAVPLWGEIVRAGFLDIRKTRQNEIEVRGEGPSKTDAAVVAGGAARGAMLGGPLGAALFGTVSLVTVTQTRARDVGLPRGLVFEVELTRDLEIPAAVEGLQEWHPSRAARPGSLERVRRAPERVASAAPPAAPESAAPSGEGAFTVKVDVDLVTVEGVARAASGRILDGLDARDFRVFEDGVERRITHFSRDLLPLAVALVVDRSGSVRRYLPELRQAALEALGELKPEDQVALFVFSDQVERPVDLTADRDEVARRIGEIEPSGGTNIYDALFDAAEYLKAASPERRRAIILVSDNAATLLGRASESGAVRMALEAEAVVYSVRTPGAPPAGGAARKKTPGAPSTVWLGDSEAVQRIARETGGEVLDVAEQGSLAAALASAISRLKLRYTLGYKPPWKARDGRFHRVELRLSEEFGCPGESYTIAARRGYYALRD
ncbi:MAG: hypothetical protein DMG07_10255 [Acidobacteria bacterium]|nr:MAG: hypothetical protein DMG07_10255 [Acidobacteriota bacterium]